MSRNGAAASSSLATRTGIQAVLATLIISGWLAILWYLAPPPLKLMDFDQPVYLSIAYDLVHLGRFTDGTEWGTPRANPARPPGMARTPLYPAFLSATALLDPEFNRSLNCFVEHSAAPACPQQAPLPRTMQFLMVVGIYLMLWRAASRATGSKRIGWLALGMGLIVAPSMIGYINTLMTETLTLFLTTAATATAVEAVKGRRHFGWGLTSGVMIGLAGLTRPAFAYLLPSLAIPIACIFFIGFGRKRSLGVLTAMLIGGTAIITPWIARNVIILGRPALTSGYASSVLAQRVAFDLVSWRQYALFYLCVLPDGTGMGNLLVMPGACKPFEYGMVKGTFYDIGNTTFSQATIVAAGGKKHQLSYLLYHFIILNPIWHALVSIPMALRGMWIGHYWGMIMALLCARLTLRSLRELNAATLAIVLPGWFMLAFYATISVDQVRYNLMLIIPFSLAGGIALNGFLERKNIYQKISVLCHRR